MKFYKMTYLSLLPLEIENIVMDYKKQLDTAEKFKKVLTEIKNIQYTLYDFEYLGRKRKVSILIYKNKDFRNIKSKHILNIN